MFNDDKRDSVGNRLDSVAHQKKKKHLFYFFDERRHG